MKIEDLVVRNPTFSTLTTANDRVVFTIGFEEGYRLATKLKDKKLGAYAAFINGSITRAELDAILGEE